MTPTKSQVTALPTVPPDKPSFIERHGHPFVVYLAGGFAYLIVIVGVFLKAAFHLFHGLETEHLLAAGVSLIAGSAVYGGSAAYVKGREVETLSDEEE